MKILVTGNKGFIAKNLIAKIQDHNVLGIDVDDFYSDPDWRQSLANIISNFSPDVIFHVGACSDTMEQRVNYMMELNYEATKILAVYSKYTGCKLIYSSSAANTGNDGNGPSNLYGWSKYAGEDIVCSIGGVALRYFNVYGPGEENKGKMASVAYQAWSRKDWTSPFKLFQGKPTRDFVHVDDVVSANLHALENYEQFQSNYFHVGSGESRSFEDVMDLMGISYTYWPEGFTPEGYQFFTVSNPNEWLPGWKPKHTIDTGIPAYLEYLNNLNQNEQN